jgi:restriction system protein
MAIPDFQTLMFPVLKAAANGEVRLSDLVERLAEEFHLSEEERRQLLPSGRQTTLANRTGWARTYLAKAGLVRATRRGYLEATERGREILARAPARIDINYLSRFPEFEQFRKAAREAADDAAETADEIVERSSRTPDEILRATHREIEKALRAELLDRLLQASPAFFETTIVNLLVNMGYGGSREDGGRVIGGSGDNGLDGVIDQDALGLDRVYIQAKRYKLDNAVGEPEVRGVCRKPRRCEGYQGRLRDHLLFHASSSCVRR